MAVFSAIGAAIAGAIGLTGVVATVVGGVIAAGLAVATARATGLFKPPSIGEADDPGVRITLSPDPSNKIPVLYGKAFTSGPIFDAAIKNSNDTMVYCIALSEETDTGTFSVQNVFLNDARLVFSGNSCISHVDPNESTDDTTYAGNVRVNVYSGGNTSSDQIFPTSPGVNAYNIVPHWGAATHTANALVYALVEIDYDPKNGLTGLPPITFEMTNSLKNPGDVLNDYLLNDRYGVGLTTSDFDQSSVTGTANTQMKGFCDELITYRNEANASVTNKRYEINGVMTTFTDVRTNIDRICTAGGTYFAYDNKNGKFKAIPNRQISANEKANCLIYNDDSIISKIDISSTELFSMYNGVEVEFADDKRKDLINTELISTPAGDRNANEPDNVLKYKIDLINDNVRAKRLANIDLNQSRTSTILQFETDFSGMQTDVGDIIKVNNSLYGYNDKLFKVMRTKEVENEGGMLTVEMTALEYDDSIYAIPDVQISANSTPINIPTLPVIPPGGLPLPILFTGYSNANIILNEEKWGNFIAREHMGKLATGGQVEDKPANKLNLGNTTTYTNLFTRRELDFTAGNGLEPGDYSFMSAGTPIGAGNASPASASVIANVQIQYANGSVQQEEFGISALNFTNVPSVLEANKKITIGPNPVSGNVLMEGFNTLDDVSGDRGFNSIRYDMLRITKGDIF